MTQALAAAALLASGIATRYDAQVMPAVVDYRQDRGQVGREYVVGYVALLDCDLIGRHVWVESGDGQVVGPVVVADCANAAHRDKLIARGWAVDLSYDLGLTFGVVDNTGRGYSVWDRCPLIAPEYTILQ